MAHPKGIALAESQEACKQWAAFQLRAQHEEAMREWFKIEKKSQRKRKQERGKTAPNEPQPTKREAKARVAAAAPMLSPVVAEHAATKFVADEIKPSGVVSAVTETGSAMTTVPTHPTGRGSAVATPIQFTPLSFELEASKGRIADRESAVMLKLRKEMEELKVCVESKEMEYHIFKP